MRNWDWISGLSMSSNVLIGVVTASCCIFVASKASQIAQRTGKEPPVYPYWIPWLGHASGLMFDSEGLLTRARAYFGSWRPFSLYVAGQRIYVLSEPNDIKIALRSSKALAWAPNIRDIIVDAHGMSPAGGDHMVAHGLIDKMNPFYTAHLIKSERLGPVSKKVYHTLDEIVREQLKNTSSGATKSINLWQWGRHSIFEAATRVLFGEGILKRHPNLFDDTMEFDDNFHLLVFKYWDWQTRHVRAAWNRLVGAVDEVLNLTPEQIDEDGVLAVVYERHHDLIENGTPYKDAVISQAGFFWAIHTNTPRVGFYFLAYVLSDPDVLDKIRKELESAVVPGTDTPALDLIANPTACPTLNAALNETLRLTSGATQSRIVVAPTAIGDRTLLPGARVLMPSMHLHCASDLWGTQPKDFQPERWIERDESKMHSDCIYRPFGGGSTYCPGRLFAKREMLGFVALVLWRFKNVRLEGGPFNSVDEKKVSLGVLHPAEGYDKLQIVFDT